MNKKTISLICLTAIYSVLFYDQHVGVNFLLFTLATLGFFFFQDKEAIKNKSVLILSFGAIFSASFAAIHGSYLSMWASIVSLMVLPGVFINKRSNVFLDFLSTLVNIVTATTFMFIDMIESIKKDKGNGNGFLRLLKYIVPIVFIIIFFFIYRAMNPLFEKLTQDVAEIVSLGFVFFTLGGFTLVYSIYKQKRSKDADEWEKSKPINIIEENTVLPQWNEGVAFSLLFTALNIMLISVNFMDVNYLYLGDGMPDGITHKEFVHKGVGMLILSIILGISILLFFFRGALNFGKNKNLIKILAFLWVAQNLFMVFSTGIRNGMYIDAALLTYKRIGVYFWLFFALIGLITLLVKLYKNKTVFYLARYNFNALFIVLILSSAADWDMVISDFNLNRAHQMDEISSLDKNYMLSLSEGNISGLYDIKELDGFEVDSIYSYRDRYSTNVNWLDYKVYDFLLDDIEGDWRSYSVRRERVRNDINELNDNGEIASVNLNSSYIKSLEPLIGITNLKELDISNSNIKDWRYINEFKFLEN
ncbi:DUF4173 domain-containing protein, partial [Vicingaceae bacterium]|nr:DUF4173 domain-containing protein [Vicingaceae bacterium]